VAIVLSHRAPLASTSFATFVAATLVAAACGSTSKTETLTTPSPVKCTVEAAADGPPFSAAGGSGSVRVAANRDCQWAAKTDASWVTIAQPTEGQGEGAVRFSVAANADSASRSASISVNNQRLDIPQAGKPCEVSVSSNHESIDGAGGNLSVSVRASADSCQWTASSGVSWIAIVSGPEGHGSGTVSLHVDPVTGPPRSGNVTIAGQTVQVDQGTGCSLAIGTDTVSIDSAGGDRQVAVTAKAGCTWTAQSQTPWIAITSAASGSGAGVVAFRIAASDGPTRSGTLVVAGRTVTVTQSPGCGYSISPSNLTVTAQAATTSVQVDSGAGCAWTAASAVPWISVASSASGNGRGQVQIAIAGNDGPARTGTITIAGQSLTIAQSGGCSYTVVAASQSLGGNGGAVAATVTTAAGCAWTASASVDWITMAPAAGVGPGQTTLAVTANASAPRTGSVTIAGRTLTVSQASLCNWTFAPRSHELQASGGTGNVLVFVSGACSWTAVPNVPWIRITAGGSGTGAGLLQFLVAANSGASRTGLIAIGGENYVVSQSGSGDSQK